MEAEALFAQVGDEWNRANALMALGAAAQDLGDLARAGRCYETGVALRRQLNGPRALGEALLRLADYRQEQLRLIEARALVEEAMTIFQRLDDAHWQAHSYGQLGLIALYRCDYTECVEHCDRAVDLLTQLERAHETVHWLYHAATAHLCLDDDAQVVHYLTRCAGVAQRFANHFWRALCTFLTGCRLLGRGQHRAALATLQEVEAQLGDRVEVSFVWAMTGYVYWRLGDYGAAQQMVIRALAAAQANSSVGTLALALPAAALLLQRQGVEPQRVAQLYALAETLPYVGASPFFWRLAGQQLVAPAQSPLPANAELDQERHPDLWTVAREVQAQLSGSPHAR